MCLQSTWSLTGLGASLCCRAPLWHGTMASLAHSGELHSGGRETEHPILTPCCPVVLLPCPHFQIRCLCLCGSTTHSAEVLRPCHAQVLSWSRPADHAIWHHGHPGRLPPRLCFAAFPALLISHLSLASISTAPGLTHHLLHQTKFTDQVDFASVACSDKPQLHYLCTQIKRKAPNCHTILEVVRLRWGRAAHLVSTPTLICTHPHAKP